MAETDIDNIIDNIGDEEGQDGPSDSDGRKIEIKPAFRERYSRLTDWEPFIKCSLTYLRRSVRVNTIKAGVTDVKSRLERQGWRLTPVSWCSEGFFVEHESGRRDIGNMPEHGLGYFYVQEAASMIPPIVLEPKPDETVLDMCAAPGSKTTQIGAYMQNKGILVANDFRGDRLQALGINTQRCGLTNIILTQMNGQSFRRLAGVFDKVLVDAPCSGTGTIRKSFKTLRIWNPNMLKKIAGEQKRLIIAGFDALKHGGIMVYSTCSLEPEEDEGIIDHLLNSCPDAAIEDIDINLKRGAPVMEWDGKKYHRDVSKCLRLWPQDNDTEGFFVAKIRKRA